MQYLGHEPVKLPGTGAPHASFLTTSTRFEPKPRVTMRLQGGNVVLVKRNEVLPPGPGHYDAQLLLESGFRSRGHKFEGAARPTTAGPVLDHSLTWTNVHRNPPSIPSTLDYGYDVASDGTLMPQKPPDDRLPLKGSPGPASYDPKLAAARPSTVAYASNTSHRVDFSKLQGCNVPGPGAYESLSATAFQIPSTRLESGVFASKTRKGIEAIIGRTSTRSTVGPGSHISSNTNSGFRPRTAGTSQVQEFGVRQGRFVSSDIQPRPGPGTYTVSTSIDTSASRAREQNMLLHTVGARRAQSAVPARRRSLSPSLLPVAPVTHASANPSGRADTPGGGIHMTPTMQHREVASAAAQRDVPPVPVFFSSTSRFGHGGESSTLPAVGQYNVGGELGRRWGEDGEHLSSGPNYNEEGGLDHPYPGFTSSAPRFSKTMSALSRCTGTGAGVGPGSYIPDVIPNARALAAASKPSPAFLAPPADRKLPCAGMDGNADTFLSGNLARTLGSRGRAKSARAGRAMGALAARAVTPVSGTPGPGQYELAPRQPARSPAPQHHSTVASMAGHLQTTHTGFGDAPRFAEHSAAAKLPGPGQYNPDVALGGRTKRTFNVALAANEARAIVHKTLLPLRSGLGGATRT